VRRAHAVLRARRLGARRQRHTCRDGMCGRWRALCVCVCVCACVCVRVRVCCGGWMHACIRTCAAAGCVAARVSGRTQQGGRRANLRRHHQCAAAALRRTCGAEPRAAAADGGGDAALARANVCVVRGLHAGRDSGAPAASGRACLSEAPAPRTSAGRRARGCVRPVVGCCTTPRVCARVCVCVGGGGVATHGTGGGRCSHLLPALP
jgi:hypothetical protein